MPNANLEDVLANAKAFAVDRKAGAQWLRFRCDHCEREWTHKYRPGMSLTPLLRNVRAVGWEVDDYGKWAFCPECKGGSKMTTPTMTPTTAAATSQVRMIRLLDQHFNAKTGLYADGWSDKRVADETSMSVAVVSSFREAGFGLLRDPEVDALVSDIKALQAQLIEDHKQLKQMIVETQNEMVQKISSLEARVQRVFVRAA